MILEGNTYNMESEALLSKPDPDGASARKIVREEVPYENLSKKYLLWKDKDVTRQYFKMYGTRLEKARPVVEAKAKAKWGSKVPLKRLFELDEGSGRSIVVGTLFKRQELKPSILKEISEEHHLVPQPIAERYVSDDDEIILEDELQRIQLVSNLEVPKLVTGITCAVLGIERVGGKFEVEDICFAGLPDPIKREVIEENRFVLFVSGIELSNCVDSLLPLELLVDYVTGLLGCPTEQAAVSKICRVIIAGNSISSAKGEKSKTDKAKLVKELDDILMQLSSLCPVDVMPGEFDPANHILPQQPLHRCMFPKASKYTTMQSVANPYEFVVGGRMMIGMSGQNVKDIQRCSTLEDPIEILESLCKWGHLAPTAPDTLTAYPYDGEEPFVVNCCPDVVFTGNQDAFATRTIEGPNDHRVTLISVPKFNTTNTCVLMNLKTLKCQTMCFSANSTPLEEESSHETKKQHAFL